MDVGAADKAAIQLVKVQPYSRRGGTRIGYVVMPHPGAGNQPGYAWCKRPGRPEARLQRWVQPGGLVPPMAGWEPEH